MKDFCNVMSNGSGMSLIYSGISFIRSLSGSQFVIEREPGLSKQVKLWIANDNNLLSGFAWIPPSKPAKQANQIIDFTLNNVYYHQKIGHFFYLSNKSNEMKIIVRRDLSIL